MTRQTKWVRAVKGNDAPLLLDVTRLVWRRWVGRHPTGIDRVCLAYLKRYASDAQAVVQHRRYRRILGRQASLALFDLLNDPLGFRPKLALGALRFGAGRPCSGDGRLYLNIGHTGLNDPGLRPWLSEASVRPVYFVHDLIPITHPEYCRSGEREKHQKRMRTVLETGAGVIGNSQATLDELAAFSTAEDLPGPPSVAAWLGTAPLHHFAVPAPKPDRPTFVVLSTIEARKNHIFLLKLWSRLIERLGPETPRLLVIGQRGWEADEAIALLNTDARLRSHVQEIGRCDDRMLATHLSQARALLFPSLAEGYGLPLIEALQIGTPVIASDLPIFLEIGQRIPDLIDLCDEAAWEHAILSYAGADSPDRRRQLERLQTFRAPTWDDHFAKVDSWLAKI